MGFLSNLFSSNSGLNEGQKMIVSQTRMAAERGDDVAQYTLGVMYQRGTFLPIDNKSAAYWFIKAAEQGNPEAQHQVGYLYTQGEGVPQDYEQASYWYAKAAMRGHDLALRYFEKAGVLLTSDDLEQSQVRFVEWLKKMQPKRTSEEVAAIEEMVRQSIKNFEKNK